DQSFDFRPAQVDDQPMFGQYLDDLVLAVRECRGRPSHVRRDQVEQPDDLGIDIIQLTLKCLPLLGHSQNSTGRLTVPDGRRVIEARAYHRSTCADAQTALLCRPYP